MKSKIKIITIILSLLIFTISIFNCCIISYATDSSGHHSDLVKLIPGSEFFSDLATYFVYVSCRIGAIVDHDFGKWIQTKEDYIKWWNNDNISIDENTGVISYSDELITSLKQALKEYAEVSNGYVVYPTTNYRLVSPSDFATSYEYQTFISFIREYGLVGVSYSSSKGTMYLTTYPEYMNGNAGFYNDYDLYDAYRIKLVDFTKWTTHTIGEFLVMNKNVEMKLSSWDEVKKNQSPPDLTYNDSRLYDCSIILKPGNYRISNSANYPFLFSEDGRHILLFNSLVALENYSVEHRTVYFGSGFYEDTGKIEVSYGELEDYLDGKYDDFLDDLRDIISDSNLTEEEIEKLVDKLLDKVGEVGDSVDEVSNNLKETNSWLEKIYAVLTDIDNTVAGALSGLGFSFDTSAIESYLDAILVQLGYISDQIDDMTADELDEKSDSLLDSLKSLFTDVGDVAKTKFPFSIPWDIYSLLTFLSGGGGSSGAPAQVSSYGYTVYSSGFLIEVYGRPGEGSDGDLNSGGHTPGQTVGGHHYGEMGAYRPGSFYLTDKGAPAFKIPFSIKSIGLEEEVVISMENFGILSYLSRAIFSAIFAYALINLTFKVLGVGKELSL